MDGTILPQLITHFGPMSPLWKYFKNSLPFLSPFFIKHFFISSYSLPDRGNGIFNPFSQFSFSWYFQGDKKGTLGRKGFTTARFSLTHLRNLRETYFSPSVGLNKLSTYWLCCLRYDSQHKIRSKLVLGILVMSQKIRRHFWWLQNASFLCIIPSNGI